MVEREKGEEIGMKEDDGSDRQGGMGKGKEQKQGNGLGRVKTKGKKREKIK